MAMPPTRSTSMVDMRTIRARTPPDLWLKGSDEAKCLPGVDASKPLNQGLSAASYLANRKQEKFAGQVEEQKRNALKPKRASVQLELEMLRSPSSMSTLSPNERSTLVPGGQRKNDGIYSNAKLLGVGSSMEDTVQFYHKEEARKRKQEKEQKLRLERLKAEEEFDDVEGPMFAARLEAQAKEFQQESEKVGRRLQDCSRKIRQHNFAGTKEDARRLEEDKERLEEERREKELEVKRARKREQMARDPNRKVNMKVESKRQFGMDAATDATIPMQSIDFNGGKSGRERIPMVDVTVLRSRCLLLQNGTTVDSLMEASAMADRRKALMLISRSMASQAQEMYAQRCSSAPSLSFAHNHTDEGDVFRPMTGLVGDDRLRMARERRRAARTEIMVHKMCSMRSQLPDSVADRFGIIDQMVRGGHQKLDLDTDEQMTLTKECLASYRSSMRSSRRESMNGTLANTLPVTSTLRKTLRATLADTATSRHHRGTMLYSAVDDIETFRIAHAKMKRHWGIVRASVLWIRILLEAKRMNAAAETAKTFIDNVGFFLKIQFAIKGVRQRILSVQRAFREFSKTKHTRVKILEKQWEEYEDDFLSKYFHLYCEKLFHYEKDESDLGVYEPKKAHQAMLDALHSDHIIDDIYHWHKFRIPAKDRFIAVEQFYLTRLRKHSKTEASLLSTATRAHDWQQDLDSFLVRMRDDHPDALSESQEQSQENLQVDKRRQNKSQRPLEYWELPRGVGLALIAMVAKSLVKTTPFDSHPANRDVLQEILGDSPPEVKKVTKDVNLKSFELPQGMELTLHGQPPKPKKTEEASEHRQDESNLEDVLWTFTPRLRDFADVEREASEPDLSHPPPMIRQKHHNLRRPSELKAAAKLQGPGAHGGWRPP